MNHTPEQLAIISHIRENDGYTLINAVAGAGKTTLLTSIAKALAPTNALYLAYNRSIANEASRKFPSSVACSTIHSFAYRATIPHYSLRLGNFTYRDLPSYIDYDRRCELLEILKGFFLSAALDFSDYATGLNDTEYRLLSSAILDMENGSIECTHEFYLKYFHILLASGNLKYNNFDFIAVDEAGDINPVTLAIVKLLPATKKILVGDSRQNIYSFNHTINCFDHMQNIGTSFPMSQSFRVSPSIAKDIQQFCTTYIDPQMQFHGTKQPNEITTRAFISRTNSALIDKMMDLNELGIPYTLTRSANDIFKLPRILCSLRKGGFVSTPEFKALQTDVDHYFEDVDLRHKHKSVLSYLKHVYQNDIQISLAINLILKYRVSGILACYEEAKKHEKLKTSYYLGTAHSTKGLEWDEVTIGDDLNSVVKSVQLEMAAKKLSFSQLTSDQQTELNLYYVACTRAHKSLVNATQLTENYYEDTPQIDK